MTISLGALFAMRMTQLILAGLCISAIAFGGFFVSTAHATITTINLDDPDGSEEWRGMQTIDWSGVSDNAADEVDITFASDGINFNEVIAANVLFSDGDYSWNTLLPDPDTLTARIRISPSGFPLVFDTSTDVFAVDNTDPVTTLTIGPIDGLNGWYITVPAMSLSCVDTGGTGCFETYYRWDGGAWVENSVTPVAAMEGSHLLEYYSEDDAVDALGAHNEEAIQSLTVKVDTTYPTVAVTSTTANGAYNAGDDINVTLTFSENVASTNTLTVTLNTGGTCSVPILSDTNIGTCTYTVASGENTGDLTVTTIVPVSGVVEDIAGNDSTLAPTSNVGDTSSIVIDTIAPVASDVTAVTETGGTTIAGWWNSTNTGADVEVSIDNDASLEDGTLQLQAEADGTFENIGSAYTILVGDLGGSHTFSLTAAEIEALATFGDGDTVSFRAVVTDIAENATTGATGGDTFTVDQTAPSVNAGTDKEVKVMTMQDSTDSDAGSGIASYLWTKETGTGTITFGTGATDDTNISSDTDGSFGIRLTVTDVAGNSAFDDIVFYWDTTVPILAIFAPVVDPTNDQTPDFTFSADSVKHLPASTGELISYAGSCKSLMTTPVDGNNTITLEAVAGGNLADATYTDCDITVTDAAGNTSVTLEVNDFEVDTIAATIASVTTEDLDENGSIDTATLVFTDEIDDSTILLTDFAIGAINPAVMTTGTQDDDTIVFTFSTEIAGTEKKTLDYTSSADDLAGNNIAPFSELSVDDAGPVLLSARTITTTSVTATFSEDLIGVTVNGGGGEFTVTGFAVSAASETADGVVTLTVATMPTDATPTVTYNFVPAVGLVDSAGNQAIDGKFAVAVDGVAPVLEDVHIESDNTDPTLAKENDTVTITFTSSEEIASPIVMIQGVEATTYSNVGNDWTAERDMTGIDVEGPVSITIDFEDVAVPTPNVGTQVTEADITDGSSVLYDRTVPSVDAGTDKEVNMGTLQDAAISDVVPPAGSGLDTWTWSQVSGPGTASFAPSASDSDPALDPDVTISADTDGTYVLKLTVNDHAGNSNEDTFTFIWDTTRPEPLTSNPSDGSTGVPIVAGTATVTFDEDIVWNGNNSRVLLVNDATSASHKGDVEVDGGDGATAVLNIEYTGLDFGAKYRINVKPDAITDVAGNSLASNFIAYFTAQIDTVPPVVNSFSAGSITTIGATLSVTTDESAACSYATTDSAYGSMTAFNAPNTGTSHTAVITGLTPATDYDYFVRCADTTTQANTMTTSAHVSFTTETPDTTAPDITNIQASSITQTGATITWTTDEAATSRVEYGPTSGYGTLSAVDASADNTSHSVALTSLTAGTEYHFRVLSSDSIPNAGTSVDGTFTTSAPDPDTSAPPVPSISTGIATVNSDSYQISGTADADTPADSARTVSVYNGASLAGSALVPIGQTGWSVSVTLTQDTANSFTAISADASGNVSAASSAVVITEDGTVGADISAPDVPEITTPDATVDADTYEISGTAANDGGVRVVTVYRGGVEEAYIVVGTAVLPVGEIDWNVTVTLVQDDINEFNAKSTDEVGNTSEASDEVTITEEMAEDTVPPVITLLGVNPQTLTVGDSYTELGATASDDVDGDISVDIEIDDSDVDMTVAGTYTVTYNVSDAGGNDATEETRTVIVDAAFDDTTALLEVTGISAIKTFATADDTYPNGWSWIFYITVPTDETEFAMKFSDFVSGVNTIFAASNIRYYTAQSSANSASTTAVTIAGANTYPGNITLDSDLDDGEAGRQVAVTVEMKVPVGSAGGSYSAQYGVSAEEEII